MKTISIEIHKMWTFLPVPGWSHMKMQGMFKNIDTVSIIKWIALYSLESLIECGKPFDISRKLEFHNTKIRLFQYLFVSIGKFISIGCVYRNELLEHQNLKPFFP